MAFFSKKPQRALKIMGLDGVELILAVEDAFQIHITDEAAGAIATVGDLYELVLGQLQGEKSNRCLTSAAFYRTRRAIVETLGIDRARIKPSTLLNVVFPRDTRREKWHRMQAAIKLKTPELRHPAWMQLSALILGVAVTVGPGIYARLFFGCLAFLFFLGVAIGDLSLRLSRSLAVSFPNGDVTVGDLARNVLAANHAAIVAEVGGWNRKDVWEALCRVIVMQTGVAKEKIVPQARIVSDLGID